MTDPLFIMAYCNDLYAPHMATMVASAVDHLPSDIEVRLTILHSGLATETIALCEASWPDDRVGSSWHYIDLARYGFSAYAHISGDTFSRFLAGSYLPDDCRQVLLLDSDMIVLKDVSKLSATPMGDATILAALNQDAPLVSMVHSPLLTASGLSPRSPYFNAGLMLVNLERWRSNKIEKRLLSTFSSDRCSARWGDQCILNVVLHEQWGILDPRWNVQVGDPPYAGSLGIGLGEVDFEEIRKEPYIVHYTGDNKPWHPECWLVYASEYHRYRMCTAFGRSVV